MCGIAGVVTRKGAAAIDQARLLAMCQTLQHRGPDEGGALAEGDVALGMRRLSIIDVQGGHQPLYNEDCSVRAVFNGEIYNYRELRRGLEARGHRFRSDTDGEVITHLWEEVGPGFAERLNGMFAIALHDANTGRFVLARDHFGIKPLYYAHTPTHLVFGSEPKAILASGLIGRTLDLTALGELIAWEYVPAPRTLFREVRKVLPGSLLELELGSFAARERRWWTLPPPEREPGNGGPLPPTPAEWEEAVDAKVREAVQRQLVSDVPLGAFLSGGVDSSLVVSGMGPGAHTFSIGFDDPSYNELTWSRRVAAHLGTRHETEVIRPDVAALFERLMHYMDDPIGDFSIFPTYLVSRLARNHVTVSLSGDGGDEVFGGYETYLAQIHARSWARLPGWLRRGVLQPAAASLRPRQSKKGPVNKLKRFVEGAAHDPALGHARWRLFLGDALRTELFTPEARSGMEEPLGAHIRTLAAEAGDRSEIDRALYVDLRSYLSDNCLVKVDRMSMACSLEARVPLLDPEVVELAFRMPAELKVTPRQTKVMLKRVAARHVPAECVYRAKEGFSIPIKHWLSTSFRPHLEELLEPSRLRADGLFEPGAVERLKREHFEGRANHSHLLWGLLVFHEWRRRWAA
ncbi:MAG: asparagine synthase (glutamine-hydrolyzing) [Gemmatimonadales bacterium]